MSNDSPKKLAEKFFANTALSYDKIVRYTTFGKDEFWKNKMLDKVAGDKILDLACGTGILTRMIAKKLPESKITAVDITTGYLEIARKNSTGFTNISWINQDAEKLDIAEKFDCITSSYIPKYCDAKILVRQCLKHLNQGGIIILHDFTYPKNKIVGSLWRLYFVLLQGIGNFIPEWKEAFSGLPNLIHCSSWVEDYIFAIKEHKLDIDCKFYTFGCSAIIFAKLN